MKRGLIGLKRSMGVKRQARPGSYSAAKDGMNQDDPWVHEH
jgi:hypothetical protein